MRDSSPIPHVSWPRLLAVATALISTATVLTWAARQDAGPGEPGRGRGPAGLSGFSIFTALDTDGQAGLSAAEIDQAAAVLLALDKNHDGRLTPDELPNAGRGGRGRGGPGGFAGRGGDGGPGREGPGGPGRGEGPGEAAPVSADDLTATLMAFDTNKDGKLTRDEVPERLQGLFDRADANKDGVLTPDEIRASAQAQAQTQSAGRGPGGRQGRDGGEGRDGGGRGGRPGGPFGGPDPLVSALDTNNDGALSLDELNAIGTVLRRFDRNGDGIVTLEEIFAGGRGRG
jgi:Ca2+-binding EF-hand superfamily protein